MHRVSQGISGKCIRATELIHAGTTLFTFDPSCTQHEKTYQTIQVSRDLHTLAHSDLTLLNHSCNPNLLVDTHRGLIFARRTINPGEELNYFYPSTEWDMARPFYCNCGDTECIQLVKGAAWTSVQVLAKHYLNIHIVELILKNMHYANTLENFLRTK